ncbi:MAG: hypothetical protein P1P88_22800 [Bacteroidales bacterium]|nr:hypothetical protein [Bacteroidales bacterium]
MIGLEGAISNINILSSTKTSYGDNTIVWQPTGINTTSDTDISYKVSVKNVVVSGEAKSFEYTVVIINPDVE